MNFWYDLSNGNGARVPAVEREQQVYVKVRYGRGREFVRCTLDVESVQVVRWCKGGFYFVLCERNLKLH